MIVWIICIIIFVSVLSILSIRTNDKENKESLASNNIVQTKGHITYYKILNVQVRGFNYLTEKEQEFIFDELSEGDHVYLRNEYDNPKDVHALIVMYRGNKLGYVQGERSKWVHFLLRKDKIGDIIVNKIKVGDYGRADISLAIYYEDEDGFEDIPEYPLEGRHVNVIETELWNDNKDTDDWYHVLHTDELCFKYKDVYKSSNYEEDCKFVDSLFGSFVQDYLAGICITKARLADKINFFIETPMARKVFWKRVDSYMSHHGYEFAKKELYSDV